MRSSYVEWCNNNEGRAYPLKEEVSRVAANGRKLPDDILADLGLIIPSDYGDVYCSAVRVTPALYSVSFASASGPLLTATFAASSYEPYTAVALTPLVDDVSGWVVFGAHRATTPEHYVFGADSESGVEERCKRIVDRVPVRKLLRLGSSEELFVDRIVRLLGQNGLTVTKEDDNTIVLTLDPRLAPLFAGPCNRYADAHDCGSTPVGSINGVEADEDGALTIRFVPHDWSPEEE